MATMMIQLSMIVTIILLALEPTMGFLKHPTWNNHQQMHDKRGIRKWFMIPGTKWCGPGHIAKSYTDLGKYRATDQCCRAHDKKCSIRIKAFQHKYHRWHFGLKTHSGCECEKRFYNCLNQAGTEKSQYVKDLYFNVYDPDCIKLKTVKYRKCVKRQWLKCVKHKTVYIKKAYFYDLHKELKIKGK